MRKLDVKDYCHTCKDFEVETIDKRTEYYHQSCIYFGEGVIKHVGDLIIAAQAQAEANKILSESITPEILEIEKYEKWDGKLPTYVGSDDGLIIDMK